MSATAFQEPTSFEVFVTKMVNGTLLAPVYRGHISSLDLKGDERVLDFGSGSGAGSRFLARRLLAGGGRLTCVDISKVWIGVARQALAAYPNVEFRQGDIEKIDLPDGGFDVVYVNFVIHDVDPADRPRILAALSRKLTPGGRLYLGEPAGQISATEIRSLMTGAGLEEISHSEESRRIIGTVYRGVFRKPVAM